MPQRDEATGLGFLAFFGEPNSKADRDLRRVLAIVVFGSFARGDADAQSDVDVLFVVDDDEPRRFVAEAKSREWALVPLVMSTESLLAEARKRPSFVAHLLDEGVTVHETPEWARVRTSLSRAVTDPAALAGEIAERTQDLEVLADVARFRNSPVTALSHIYAIARSLVIARLLEQGIHEYSWKRIFDRYAEIRPELRHELESLKALRPYYEYARARRGATPPEQQPGAPAVGELVGSAYQLAE